jgi:hypothetical protein
MLARDRFGHTMYICVSPKRTPVEFGNDEMIVLP